MTRSIRSFLGIMLITAFAGCSDSDITLPDPGDDKPGDPKTSLVEPGSTPLELERPLLV